jgi:hypothetical protein
MQRRVRLAAGLIARASASAVLGWWLARRPAAAPGAGSPASAASPEAPEMPPTAEAPAPGGAAEPAHRIGEGGRLSIDAAELPRDGAFALALDLPDAARGSEPRPVRIVSQDGTRALELLAAPLAGSGSGVALHLDPAWLIPDRYLIEVTTAEATHFPLRRYVLELRAARPPAGPAQGRGSAS